MEQLQMFTAQRYKITTPIRLIELFAGVGSQAMALRDIGADFEHYRVVEFDKYAVKSYNAIHGTNFTVTDIRDIHGADLGIVDKDKYTYLMTYSFPCTDLSVAGKMQGMKEGTGTRSSLLWEVKRLLAECEELPQLLLMENVPQVHGKKNIDEFKRWNEFLKTLGYTTVWKDMNAKDYGVAQSRNRCFALSMLGNYSYEFPEGYKLDKTVRDYLEDEVDEKYYINSERAKKLIEKLIADGKLPLQTDRQTDRQVLCKLDKPYTEDGFTSMPDAGLRDLGKDVAGTITARYYKGLGANGDNVILQIDHAEFSGGADSNQPHNL